ncbi:MAG: metalloenzyme [Dethiobacteria bacterium]|jgi:2,3-bisphosphoglycerate-independent phosphoglycerate mutase
MSIIFIFIDGLGLGSKDESNPFFVNNTPFITKILEGSSLTREAAEKELGQASLLGLDATLGVEGLPQSATGQTTLFTGVNAAKYLGRHLRAFPNRSLKKILLEKGMFRQLHARSLKGTFANSYRPEFFHKLISGDKRHFSCSTLINYYAGLQFRNFDDLNNGDAVNMDITNHFLRERGYDVPLVSPQEAGKRLVKISRGYDLTLYEYFASDIAGHTADFAKAAEVVNKLDTFLGSVAESIDPEKELVLVTSDHGNLENMNVKIHTNNPVPALAVGKDHRKLFKLLKSRQDISGVLPSILEVLRE